MRKITLFIALMLIYMGVMAQGFGGNSSLPDYQSQTNIDYVGDNHIGHKLDIYFPNDEKATHPVIIHIYGSAWASNNLKSSADLNTVGVAALEAGYIFVTPNHRSSADAIFPAQIQDIKAVVRYLHGNAQSLGIDTSFIAVSGFSSGAHLAALMGVTGGITEYTVGSVTMDIEGALGNYINQSSAVDAVCSWSGMLELRDQGGCSIPGSIVPFIESFIGSSLASNPDKWALASANTYVDANDAPAILFHGSEDAVYPSCVSGNFYNNLRNAGVDCEYFSHNGPHGVNADYTDEMITFFDRIKAAKASATALDNTSVDANALKCIKDGVLLILRDGKTYNAQGAEVR
jgi:acetyl esterase/lipase